MATDRSRLVAKDRLPDSVKRPLSAKAGYADPFLYGGASFIVGIVGLIGGLVLFVLGNGTVAGYLSALSAILILAGYLVARRGK